MKNSFLILLLAIGAAATAQAQTTSGTQLTATQDFWKGKTATSSVFDWETAANWSVSGTNAATVPTTAYDATFNAVGESGAASTITITQTEQPNELQFNNGSYTITGASSSDVLWLSASGTTSGFGNTAISLSGSNQNTTAQTAYTDTINVPVDFYTYTYTGSPNAGTYGQQVALAAPTTPGDYAANLTFNGLVTNEAGTLEFNGQAATSGLLTIAGGLVNNSKIQFTGGTTTISTTGSTAASGSTVALVAGPSSGGGTINLNVAGALAGSTFADNVTITTTPIETINIGANQAIVGSGSTPGVAAFNEATAGLSSTTLFTMNGYSQTFGVLTLTKGTLEFDLTGANTDLAFADSSGVNWGTTTNAALEFLNFDPTSETISFGNSSTALTTTQLADITLDGGAATLNSQGDLVEAPEPSTWSLMIIGAFGLVGIVVRARRKSMF